MSDIDFQGRKGKNVSDGVNPQDVVTVAQLNNVIAGQITNVANSTAMVALNKGDGFIIRVLTYRDFFFLDKTTTRTAVANQVIQSTVNAAWWWVRLCIPDPFWATILAWNLSPSGNDENDGVISPIKTHAELERRTRGVSYSSSRVVTLLGDYTEAPVISCTTRNTAFLAYTCTPTTLSDRGDGFTGSVTTLISLNKSSNQPWTITDSALPLSNSFAAFVGQPIHFYDAGTSALIGTALIAKDLGSKTARLSSVTLANDTWNNTGINSPGTIVNGCKYRVIKGFKLPPPLLIQRPAQWMYYGLTGDVGSTYIPVSPPDIGALFKLCVFPRAVAVSSVNINAYQCSFTQFLGTDAQGGFVDCLARDNQWNISGSSVDFFNDMMFQGGGCFLQRMHTTYQTDIGLFDAAVPAITLAQVNTVFMRGLLWGNNNTAEIVNMINNHNHLVLTQSPVAITSGNELALASITGTFAALGSQFDGTKQNSITYSS